MKRGLAVILALLLAVLPVMAMAASSYQDVRDSVVRMYVIGTFQGLDGSTTKSAWTGSAFAVGNSGKDVQYFVTNHHVTGNIGGLYTYGTLVSVEMYVVYDDMSNMISAQLVGTHEYADLAVVKTNSPTNARKAVRFYDKSKDLSRYDGTVYTLGFPGVADYYLSNPETLPSNADQVVIGSGKIQRVLSHADTQ